MHNCVLATNHWENNCKPFPHLVEFQGTWYQFHCLLSPFTAAHSPWKRSVNNPKQAVKHPWTIREPSVNHPWTTVNHPWINCEPPVNHPWTTRETSVLETQKTGLETWKTGFVPWATRETPVKHPWNTREAWSTHEASVKHPWMIRECSVNTH